MSKDPVGRQRLQKAAASAEKKEWNKGEREIEESFCMAERDLKAAFRYHRSYFWLSILRSDVSDRGLTVMTLPNWVMRSPRVWEK